MFIPGFRPRVTSIAGKKTGSIQLKHALIFTLVVFAALSGLYLMAVHDTAPDKDAEKNAALRKQIEYQFQKNATKFANLLPPKADVPSVAPAALKGKVAVVGQIGYLHPLHWELPVDLCAERPDDVHNLIIVSYEKETPGLAARLYFYDFDRKAWLGKVDIKHTPDMDGKTGYAILNGALSDTLWSWSEKQGGGSGTRPQ